MKTGTLFRQLAAAAFLPITYSTSRLGGGIRILMYHRVSPVTKYDQLTVTPEQFARQIAYLAQHFRLISLDQAFEEIQNQDFIHPAIALTFDDGYRDNLEFALPILQSFKVPATIFVTTGFCDQTLRHPRYPNSEERLHLTWDEVRLLANTPGITIGSHTMTHPYLSRVIDHEAMKEISESRERLESEINRPVDLFCYPSGDVTIREQQMVKLAGYKAAVSVSPGINIHGVANYALRRTEITDRDKSFDLFMKIHGAYDPIHALLHWRRRKAFARAAHNENMKITAGESN